MTSIDSDVPAEVPVEVPVEVLVLAELNPDLLLSAPSATVSFGQVETELSDSRLTLGSSGAITAAALAALGVPVGLCATVGDDEFGRGAVTMLRAAGVDASAVIVRPELRTGITVVVNAPGGDRALLTYPGAMAALAAGDVPPAALARARHVHVSSIFLQHALRPGLAALLKDLRDRGVSTSLDTGWDPAQRWDDIAELLAHLSLLLPNAAELEQLCARLDIEATPGSPDWFVEPARALARRGPTVAVKLGGNGGYVTDGTAEGSWQICTEPLEPVDTTGAGDNFNAGYLSGLLAGAAPADCLAAAIAAGRVSVTGHGGTGRLLTPAERDAEVARLSPTAHRP
ncbi:PfkB family carbohydrate kinase [Jatrophihabitans telluris]|uniref:PfkB family carbohydrate kinase n=1 Tax=Jatrophihabitans telluris TaxID=2038343 RepID=A0ABY4QY82_9ACTN|nr:PfkB family carbohydrate kinase [Jatrophihabitans telluris]UQX88232.1 PfkB family carbohydrate kinase [Jatrophihabitans telluris]